MSNSDITLNVNGPAPIQATIQTVGLRGPQGIKGDTGDVGPAFKVDAFDLFANRHLYDASPKNFAFFATDNGNVYIHGTGNAVWSAGIPFQGPQGLKGDVGATGSAGTNGTNGTNGKDGSNGLNGTNGVDGKSAYQVAVADGYSGTEAQWLASLVGAKGDKGDTGSQGLKGDPGSTGSTGSQGAQGNPGTPGTPGTAATISVGTVTTGAAGSSVTITNSGTTSAAVLNFTIPKGDTGAAGSGGGTYTAGTGLTLNSNVFAADTTILAPLASPALTGTATAVNLTVSGSLIVPTQTAGDNTTKAASTAFVTTAVANGVASKANISSPTFTGTPAAPTAALGVANTQLATTGFVATSINSILTKSVAGGVNVTLSSAEAAYTTVILTGAITANIAVILPNSKGPTTFKNNTTGAFTVTMKTVSGTGIAVTQGQANELYADGTNVVQCQTDFVSTALTGTPTAPTATSGTNTTQIATTAFVASAVSGVASTPGATGATGAPGRGIQNLTIDGNGHLQVAYTDSTSADLGVVVGAAGATGQTGAAGANGAAATVTLGTVTTGAAGSSVAITNSGTTSAAVLNFTIPQGAQGSVGATGGTGPAGPGVPAGGASGYVLSKNSATDFDTAWIAAPSGGGSYTLETDTAPTLNYPLQLNGKDVKSTISTNGGVQNIKMLPSATTVGASLVLTAQKPDDSASVASITLAAQSGGNYGGVTISHRSNGVTIQNLGNSATYLLPSTAGLSGQLMTSSGPAGSLTWTTPVTPHPGYKVGNYYTSEFASASNTANAFGNNLAAVPIFIPVATNMDQLGVYSGTLSNSTSINLGIYNNSAGYPTSLIASGTVTIASSSTSYTIATGTKALAAGWYWLAAVASGTMTGIPVIVPDGALGPIVGSASMGQFAGNALSIGFTYAALPTTFPANATRSNSGSLMPVTYWRAA